MKLGLATSLLLAAAPWGDAKLLDKKSLRSRQLQESFEGPCTAVLSVKVDLNDPNGVNTTSMCCMTVEGVMHEIEGACREWIDDVIHRDDVKSALTVFETPGAAVNGTTGKLELASWPPEFAPPPKIRADKRSMGERKVMAVRVVYGEDEPTVTSEQVANAIFGSRPYYYHFLRAQLGGCSEGKLSIRPSVRVPRADRGVVTINVPSTIFGDEMSIQNYVTKQLNHDYGVQSPSELADYVFYCMPQDILGDVVLRGYAYSWLGILRDQSCADVTALMRVMGNMMGLAPARTWMHTYGDRTGHMGDIGWNMVRRARCYNSAKLYQLDWFQENVKEYKMKDEPLEHHTLVGFMKRQTEPVDKIIKFDRTSPTDFYMMCNWRYWRHVETYGLHANRLVIARQSKHGLEFADSYLIATISEGETFTEKGYYDGMCDLTVTLHSMDSRTGLCDISVSACDPDMPTPAPTNPPTGPTPVPTESPTLSPTTYCLAIGETCRDTTQCCNHGNGVCEEISENEPQFSHIVCKEPDVPLVITYPGTCNNDGVCDPGENCLSCNSDCNGKLEGERDTRYCCDAYDGSGNPSMDISSPEGKYSVPLNDSRCKC